MGIAIAKIAAISVPEERLTQMPETLSADERVTMGMARNHQGMGPSITEQLCKATSRSDESKNETQLVLTSLGSTSGKDSNRSANKGLPLRFGRGVCETPNPKMGAPDPENPLFLVFSVLRGGLRP